MPYEALQYVVGRALTDPAFHDKLLRAPAQALADVPLSEEERHLLTSRSYGSLQALAKRIDAWLSSPARPERAGGRSPVMGAAFDGFDAYADLAPEPAVEAVPLALRRSA